MTSQTCAFGPTTKTQARELEPWQIVAQWCRLGQPHASVWLDGIAGGGLTVTCATWVAYTPPDVRLLGQDGSVLHECFDRSFLGSSNTTRQAKVCGRGVATVAPGSRACAVCSHVTTL